MTPQSQPVKMMTEVEAYIALEHARAIVIDCCIKLDLHDLHNRITVEWEDRLTTTMGNARTFLAERRGEIKLAPMLWARASEADRINTVVHEAAHVLAGLIHNRCCGHGPLWVNVMTRLGARATRCHAVSTEGLRRKALKFRIVCTCGLRTTFTPQKRAQLMTGRRGFHCSSCLRSFTSDNASQMVAD